jgi:hypothetical protein
MPVEITHATIADARDKQVAGLNILAAFASNDANRAAEIEVEARTIATRAANAAAVAAHERRDAAIRALPRGIDLPSQVEFLKSLAALHAALGTIGDAL